MRWLKFAFQRETLMPMLALVFATGVSVALVLARIAWTGRTSYKFLLWNLFLAWLPLVFALIACSENRSEIRWSWRFLGFGGVWLLFFPNAPYIFTDLIHLTSHYYYQFWVDLTLILLCAFTGLVIGFVSLFLMQSMVRKRFGGVVSWVFIAAVAGLSGFGTYVGRFLRFNSWDVIWKPMALGESLSHLATNPGAHRTSLAFPILFGTFLFTAYLMLYALTHLQHTPKATVQPTARRPSPGAAKPPCRAVTRR